MTCLLWSDHKLEHQKKGLDLRRKYKYIMGDEVEHISKDDGLTWTRLSQIRAFTSRYLFPALERHKGCAGTL